MEPLEIAGNNGNSSIRHLLVASTFILLLCQCSDESRDNMKTKPRNAEYSDLIQLPAPEIQKLPILRIISARRSAREFATVKLPKNVLSNLLYAAYGVNRPKTGRRTAPSTYNWQYIDVYVADDEALYLYDAFGNALKRIKTGDIRAQTGRQEYVATAPVNLIYVFDTKKWPDKDKSGRCRVSMDIPGTRRRITSASRRKWTA